MGGEKGGGRLNVSFREINFNHLFLYFCQFPVDKCMHEKQEF